MLRQTITGCIVVAAFAFTSAARLGAQTPAGQAEKGSAGQHHTMKGMTEAEFVAMMIKHHQGGVDMTRHEERHGSSAEVKALAAKIRQAQERELSELKSHAGHAGGATGTSGHAEHEKTMDEHHQAAMKHLTSASGHEVDRAFLEEMVKHHEQAIDMAQGAKIETSALKQLAQKMVSDQRREMGELKKLQSAHRDSK